MRFHRFLAAAALAIAGLATAGSEAARAQQGAVSSEAVREATAGCRRGSAAAPRGVIGISDPHTLDPGVFELIRATGVDWVRAEFHWSRIQPAPDGDYDWAPYDAMVARFQKAGIHIQGILTYIPDSLMGDWPAVDRAFQRFAAAAVRRYAPRGVHHWEVFNEPNLTGYGWLTRSEAATDHLGLYTLLLARANAAVRENDPEGAVILGGLASDNSRGITAETTMETIYGLGGRDCFDIFAFHPYGYQNRFPEARARMDAIMAAGADAGKPLWFNEYGWTEQADMDMARNPTPAGNPMMAAFAQRNAADALFWFSAKDYSGRWRTPEFGLADFNLNRRPSFDTFRKLVGEAR